MRNEGEKVCGFDVNIRFLYKRLDEKSRYFTLTF